MRKKWLPGAKPVYDPDLNCYRVPLSQGKHALIDAEDAERVGQHVWHYRLPRGRSCGSICAERNPNLLHLSRFIMGAKRGEMVSFETPDRFDCRRSNLRLLVGSRKGIKHFKPNVYPITPDRKPYFDAKAGSWVLPLTKGQVAKIDVEDAERCGQFHWYYEPHSNARRRKSGNAMRYTPGDREVVMLQRFIMNVSEDVLINHVNDDTLDCRKANLRFANRSNIAMRVRKQNRPTTSKYKGVSLIKKSGKWVACIRHKGVLKSLGHHSDERQAAEAYDTAARELFGDFARPNFPN